MAIQFLPAHFIERAAAVAQLKAKGLHSIEADLEPQDLSGPAHVHPYDVEIYMLGGVFELTDSDAGVTHRLEAGCKAVVPANTLHAEFSAEGFSAVFGLSVDPGPLRTVRVRKLAAD